MSLAKCLLVTTACNAAREQFCAVYEVCLS